MQSGRHYEIDSDEGEVQLSLHLDGVQIGGAVFPADLCAAAVCIAHEMGEAYLNNSYSITVH